MAVVAFKEPFVGKYDGVIPPTLLEPGWVAGGENMRKVSVNGGWKPRKGCALHNTTAAESGAAIKSLHRYENPLSEDYHFIAQCNSKLLDATTDPPTKGTTFGTDLGVTVGTTPGFSCTVREDFFYADGSSAPVCWGGDTPRCSGLLVERNAATGYYHDFTKVVTDGRSDTSATLGVAASDVYYVCGSEILDGITLDLGTVNTTDAATITVYSWVSGAWADRSATDGTLSSGKTHAQDGSITWTRNSTDTMQVLGGIMGYWYKIVPSAALTDGVTVISCTVTRDATTITNKWDGILEWVSGCRFRDASDDEYEEVLGKVSNESTSMYMDISEGTTSDLLLIKTPEPATGFAFGVVPQYANLDDAQIDLIEYWDGTDWVDITTFTDGTLDGAGDSSFAGTGLVTWNGAATTASVKRTMPGDAFPGHWYRVTWDATLDTNTRIFLVQYMPFPESLPAYDGCVEFKGRLFLWGDPEYPNRLRYSAKDMPDCFSGRDSGYTDQFGDMKKVLCAVPFYNELIVFKEDSVFLLEGYSPGTFGVLKVSNTVGLASPKTAHVVEVGYKGMHEDEPMSIAIWQDVDGVYVFDGRKPKKASPPVDDYFNVEYSNCIAAASIRNRQAFTDKLNNEYHFLLPSDELVYNYLTDEWYPIWSRALDLDTGLCFKGTDDRFYTYGATSAGFVMKLETDTTDKNASDADVKIDHSIKTRAIGAVQKSSPTHKFTFRNLWAEFKAQSSGTVTTKTFKNNATSGTTQSSPSAMSMVNSGYSVACPKLNISLQDCDCVQIEFSESTADVEMEIRGITYTLDVLGEPD